MNLNELLKRPETLSKSEIGMSNFDHSIDPELDERLRKFNEYAQHSAWNFCGYVWFDGSQFCEEIWRFNRHIDTLRESSLQGLMKAANNEYGWD